MIAISNSIFFNSYMTFLDSAMPLDLETLDRAHVEYLRSLKRANGEGLLTEMVNLMLKETPERLVSMRDIMSNNPTSLELAALAHKVAGSCASIGAKAMRQCSQSLEKTSKMMQYDELPEKFASVEAAWLLLEQELVGLKARG